MKPKDSTCKNRCRYSRKRATFCQQFDKNWQLPSRSNIACVLGDADPCSAEPREAALSSQSCARVRPRGPRGLAEGGHGMRQTLQDSFSAVSKRNFASKYAFESSRRDLHNALLRTALRSHFSKNLLDFAKSLLNFAKFSKKFGKF